MSVQHWKDLLDHIKRAIFHQQTVQRAAREQAAAKQKAWLRQQVQMQQMDVQYRNQVLFPRRNVTPAYSPTNLGQQYDGTSMQGPATPGNNTSFQSPALAAMQYNTGTAVPSSVNPAFQYGANMQAWSPMAMQSSPHGWKPAFGGLGWTTT